MSHNHVHNGIVLLHPTPNLVSELEKQSRVVFFIKSLHLLFPLLFSSCLYLGTCHSSSESWVILPVAFLALTGEMPSAVTEFCLLPCPSLGFYKRGNLVPIPIFLKIVHCVFGSSLFFFYGGSWASDTGHIFIFVFHWLDNYEGATNFYLQNDFLTFTCTRPWGAFLALVLKVEVHHS